MDPHARPACQTILDSGNLIARNRSFESEPTGGERMSVKRFAFKCARCGLDDTVPFQPRDDRPLYCRDCVSWNFCRGMTAYDNSLPGIMTRTSSPLVSSPYFLIASDSSWDPSLSAVQGSRDTWIETQRPRYGTSDSTNPSQPRSLHTHLRKISADQERLLSWRGGSLGL